MKCKVIATLKLNMTVDLVVDLVDQWSKQGEKKKKRRVMKETNFKYHWHIDMPC